MAERAHGLASLADLPLALITVDEGQHAPREARRRLAATVARSAYLPLASVAPFYRARQKSPFARTPWRTGGLHLRMVVPPHPTTARAAVSPSAILHASRAPRVAVGILHCPSWAATGRTLEQAYAAFTQAISTRVATSQTLPPLSVRLFAFEPLEQHAAEDRAVGGSRGMENLIVFPHGSEAAVAAHVHTMLCDLAAEAVMALESWVLSATPEVVGLLTPLDLLDLSDTRGGGTAALLNNGSTATVATTATNTSTSTTTSNPAKSFAGTEPATYDAATTASVAQPPAPSAPLPELANVSLDDRERTILRHGRLRKSIGDVCLMVGSPLDALEHYETSAELSRQVGDTCWHAAALEGRACATLLAHYLGLAIDDGDAFDGGAGAHAVRLLGAHGKLTHWANATTPLPDSPTSPRPTVEHDTAELVVTTEVEADAIREARTRVVGMLREAANLLMAHSKKCSAACLPRLEAELRLAFYLAQCPLVRVELGAGSSADALATQRRARRAEVSLAVARCEVAAAALPVDVDRMEARIVLASLCHAAERFERRAVHLSASVASADAAGTDAPRMAPRAAAHALRSALDCLSNDTRGHPRRTPLWPSAEAAALAALLAIASSPRAGEPTEAARAALKLLRMHAVRIPASVQEAAMTAIACVGCNGEAPQLFEEFGPPRVRFVRAHAPQSASHCPVSTASYQRASAARATEEKRRGEGSVTTEKPAGGGGPFLVDRRRAASRGVVADDPATILLNAALAPSPDSSARPSVTFGHFEKADAEMGVVWLLDEVVEVQVEVTNECIVALPWAGVALWIEAVEMPESSAKGDAAVPTDVASSWCTYFEPSTMAPPTQLGPSGHTELTLRGVPRRRWCGEGPAPLPPIAAPAACFIVRGLFVTLASGASWRAPFEPGWRRNVLALAAWKRRNVPPPLPKRKGAAKAPPTEVPISAPTPVAESRAVVALPAMPLLDMQLVIEGIPASLPPPPVNGPLPAWTLLEGENVSATLRLRNASPARQHTIAYVTVSTLESSSAPGAEDEVTVSLAPQGMANWHDQLPLSPGRELMCAATLVAGRSRGSPRTVGFSADYVGWLEPASAGVGRRTIGAVRVFVDPGIEVSHVRLHTETKIGLDDGDMVVPILAQVVNCTSAVAVYVDGTDGALSSGGVRWVSLVVRAHHDLVTSAAGERGKQKDRFTNELRAKLQAQLALPWRCADDSAVSMPPGTAVPLSRERESQARHGVALIARGAVSAALEILFNALT